MLNNFFLQFWRKKTKLLASSDLSDLKLIFSSLSSYLFPDAEWIAHSEQLCHSTQHPSLPPSHPSVTLHGVQRHHLGLCDRTHMAAGQWQCAISPQLWHRYQSGLQEHDSQPRRHSPRHRLGVVKSAPQTDRWGGEEVRDGKDRRQQVCPLWLQFVPAASFLWRTWPPPRTHIRGILYVSPFLLPVVLASATHSQTKDTRGLNNLSIFWENLQDRCT